MISQSKTIVCFGDSNTYGYDAVANARFCEDERWTCLLSDFLGKGYLIREEGMGGRTTVFEDPLFEGLSGLSSLHSVLMTHSPISLLIIMLGTNDVKQRFSATAENISQGLDRLVTKAMNTLCWKDKPNILIMAPPPIREIYKYTDVAEKMGDGCDIKSAKLPALYEKLAKEKNLHFLDVSSIPGVSMCDFDGMHLTVESHRSLAKYLAERIPDLV